MDTLPDVKQKKLINKKAFIELAKKVRRSFEIERAYLDKIKNDKDYPTNQSCFYN
ncbi:MAG: hypothetical protein ACD_12C00848G0002 [uncultured bacterium]|nr:MAG: hypothetical protein ACD_12C00848G0002 [uncultured bacterium]